MARHASRGTVDGRRASDTITERHCDYPGRAHAGHPQPTGRLEIREATLHCTDVSADIPLDVLVLATGAAGRARACQTRLCKSIARKIKRAVEEMDARPR